MFRGNVRRPDTDIEPLTDILEVPLNHPEFTK